MAKENCTARMARLEERADNHHEELKNKVSQDRFRPVEKIAYGMAASALLAMLGAIYKLVLRAPM